MDRRVEQAGADEQPRGEGAGSTTVLSGRRRFHTLSARLIVLTLVFAVVAQAVVFVPSMAAYRRSWLNDRLAAAQIAALVLEAAPDAAIPPAIEERLLDGVGVLGMALSTGGARHLLSHDTMPTQIARTIDLREMGWLGQMSDALEELLTTDERAIRVVGEGKGEIAFVELIMDPQPMRTAMLNFAARAALVSLLVWGAAAGALYLAMMQFIVRPVRRLTNHITAFERDPGNASMIIAPSDQQDEIGMAERALARMERTLASELRQQQRLATLGLAVAKISHELRNMLTSAQLMSDRLSQVADPVAERFVPRLLSTLDRAIAFCESALAYGRVAERLPNRQRFALYPVVEELRYGLNLADHPFIVFETDIAQELMLDADPEQISRILLNLGRNAVQALEQAYEASTQQGAGESHHAQEYRLVISAQVETPDGRETAVIHVTDNGPGLAPQARARLFEAFHGTTRPGGSGLGLPIAYELVRLHGGTITLEEGSGGARFRIELPT